MSITVNTKTGMVWVDGAGVPTNATVAKLIGLLDEHRDELVTHEQIEKDLNIATHTRNAYLSDARKIVDVGKLRIRSVRGQGVVLERVPEEVAA